MTRWKLPIIPNSIKLHETVTHSLTAGLEVYWKINCSYMTEVLDKMPSHPASDLNNST